MRKERGITFVGMVLVGIVIVLLAIGGLKIAPAYIEYFTVKKAIDEVAQTESRGTVGDIRGAFDRHAAIDDIEVISSKDLDISKDGNQVVISFSYSKKVPLFANVSVLIDFSASSNQ